MMTIIILLCVFSCSEIKKKECRINFEKSHKINSENIITDLTYSATKKTLVLSVLNLKKETIRFILPKVVFGIPKKTANKKDDNNNIVVKRFIPNVFIIKSISYIGTDSNKKLVDVDSTMQRDEKRLIISLGSKEKFTKELFFDCEKSDKGNYNIYFLEDNDIINLKVIDIQFPKDAILQIIK